MSAAFHELTVAEIRRETEDAVAVRLTLPADCGEAFAFTPGQHLTLRRLFENDDVRRNYSICAAPGEGELWVAIKQVPGGQFSSWANSNLKQGDLLEAMPPHGSFTWKFTSARRAQYLGIAAGSGITPILSLIKTMLAEEPDSSFTLLYGNRHSGSVMFLEELAALKNRNMGRLQIHHFLSGEEEDIDLFNGRLDAAKLVDIFERLVDPSTIEAAFLCGPGAMMDAAQAALLAKGVLASAILAERFTADRPTGNAEQRAAMERQSQGRTVSVTLDGRKRSISFDSARGSILENARAAGMPAPYACKAGVCATCRAKLVTGDVHMEANYGLSPDEIAQGYILTCQAMPLTDDVSVNFDA
ncbi:phenylacetate-CoA oxygenase [Altererythrobacter sp. B11]|uniref:1,2-phenylacetyl-CoA epoxidase subunit PaaE n=1 Tax=Altererythrobacter sp. B11 TaxID=2060312 RepID=UPI000DC6F82A|nr:1,2-phenylacetyl-CoA epoxidase subunit PaaE [Altererythrobacter sp. B11]BBC73290.1 phenylacetate-CoA oxygenase [Altererythrobacter sp. B11]